MLRWTQGVAVANWCGGEAITQCQSAGHGLQLNGQFSGVAAVPEKSASFQEVGDSLVSGGSERSWVLKVKVADARLAAFVKPAPEAMVVERFGLEKVRENVLQAYEAVQVCRLARCGRLTEVLQNL